MQTKINARLVGDIVQLLRNLAMLMWVPDHCDIQGNKEAEQVAVKASSASVTGLES